MEKAGYHATVRSIVPRAQEGGLAKALPLYTWLHRYSPRFAGRMLALYLSTLPIWGWPTAIVKRLGGFRKFMVGVGYPQ